MLLEFPKGIVKADGKDVLEDVRINIVGNQARMKFKVFKDSKSFPMDIILYDIHTYIKGIGVVVAFNGNENFRNISFNLELYYGLRKKSWQISGTVNGRIVSSNYGSLVESMVEFKNWF